MLKRYRKRAKRALRACQVGAEYESQRKTRSKADYIAQNVQHLREKKFFHSHEVFVLFFNCFSGHARMSWCRCKSANLRFLNIHDDSFLFRGKVPCTVLQRWGGGEEGSWRHRWFSTNLVLRWISPSGSCFVGTRAYVLRGGINSALPSTVSSFTFDVGADGGLLLFLFEAPLFLSFSPSLYLSSCTLGDIRQ